MHTGQRIAAYIIDSVLLWTGLSLFWGFWPPPPPPVPAPAPPPLRAVLLPGGESVPPLVLLPDGETVPLPGAESIPAWITEEEEFCDEEGPDVSAAVFSYFTGTIVGAVRAPFTLVVPLLYFWLFTGLGGTTLGKLVMRIRVANRLGRRPGLVRALGREFLKVASATLVLPALVALLQLHGGKPAWYDRLCRTHIEEMPPWVRRTRSQKNFLKHYKDVR